MTHDPPQNDGAANEAYLRAILDTTVDGIVSMRPDGTIIIFNQAAERIFGQSAETAIGNNIAMLMPPDMARQHGGFVERYLTTGATKIIGIGRTVQGRRKDGTEFPMDLAVSEVTIEGETHFTAIIRDLTEQVNMRRALDAQQSLLAAILDTVGALVIVLDPRGHAIRFNRSCERATGYTLNDLDNQPFWHRLVPPEEHEAVTEAFKHLVARGESSTFENRWITRSGDPRLIAWSNTTLVDEHGKVTHVIGTGIDITDQRRAEEAIVAVSEAERRLIGQDLHDALGQQLTGITLLTKALAKSLVKAHPTFADEADSIAQLAREAVTESKRIAHGLYPTGMERVGLTSALGELADTLQKLFKARCTFEGSEDLPTLDQSVQLHLYRIAQEATNNAVKHSQCEQIEIRLEQERGAVRLTVLDDGIGIPAEIPCGDGMGVPIMQYRARMMNARLEIARRPQGGTMLACSVPFGQTTD